MKIPDLVRELAEPIAKENGCSLWDVEYVREGGERFLRVYLDKPGGVNIADCEAVSRALDPILDEKDPIPERYNFEVCSAGLERALKRESDFQAFLGSAVTVKLYRPQNGTKEFTGTLAGYQNGDVTLTIGGQNRTFTKAEVAQTRLHADF